MRKLGIFNSLIFFMLAFFLIGFSPLSLAALGDWFQPCPDGNILKFRSGFDEQVNLNSDELGKFAGIKSSGSGDCSIVNRLFSKDDFAFGRGFIQFDGGSSVDRAAEIVADPINPSNKVMSFWVKNPNVMGPKGFPIKGRVQMNVYGNKGLKNVRLSVNMFLPVEMSQLKEYPDKIDWLTISEWWNNAAWTGEAFPFRISVNLYKDKSYKSSPLFFQVHAQSLKSENNKWEGVVWEFVNRNFEVPFGKWVTLEYEFVEGNMQNGQFTLSVMTDDKKKNIIFDVHDFTHHPDDPNPDGLSHFNPIKLYTSVKVINYLSSLGTPLKVYWDDIKISSEKRK